MPLIKISNICIDTETFYRVPVGPFDKPVILSYNSSFLDYFESNLIDIGDICIWVKDDFIHVYFEGMLYKDVCRSDSLTYWYRYGDTFILGYFAPTGQKTVLCEGKDLYESFYGFNRAMPMTKTKFKRYVVLQS